MSTHVINKYTIHLWMTGLIFYRKFVKDENSEMEQTKRMSSTPMTKVQEDNTALRQFLSMVSSGLQRNTCAVDQLKREMIQVGSSLCIFDAI